MKTILVTGCNRGIGLGLVEKLLTGKSPPDKVLGTCRSMEKASALQRLSREHSNLHVLELDVNDFASYPKFVGQVEGVLGNDGLNVLVNNAGISSRFARIGLVKHEQMLDNFRTNTVAPVMLAKSLLPLLKAASKKNDSLPVGTSRAAVVNVSSILGSIRDNDVGGFYPYRCSKAALNAATKSLSIDLREDKILVVSVHPGWCKTDMGGPNAPLAVGAAVTSLLSTLAALTEDSNGTFLQYDGKPLPW